ncbi:MAG TPA: LysE family transporter [Chryseosolibacter sp.]|nr:LysE family transporter [Chryseosolibacter sp.]
MVRFPSYVKHGPYLFLTGFLISFLASLPPGMTNIITIRLATSGEYVSAMWFALGIFMAEIIYAKICSLIVRRMLKFDFIMTVLQWVVLLVLAVMTVMSFTASGQSPVPDAEPLPASKLSPLVLGFVLMAINPVQIPFWLGWATILTERKLLTPGHYGDMDYLVGVGLGSLAASALFIFFGGLLFSFAGVDEQVMHFIFGCVFAVMTMLQAKRVLLSMSNGRKT